MLIAVLAIMFVSAVAFAAEESVMHTDAMPDTGKFDLDISATGFVALKEDTYGASTKVNVFVPVEEGKGFGIHFFAEGKTMEVSSARNGEAFFGLGGGYNLKPMPDKSWALEPYGKNEKGKEVEVYAKWYPSVSLFYAYKQTTVSGINNSSSGLAIKGNFTKYIAGLNPGGGLTEKRQYDFQVLAFFPVSSSKEDEKMYVSVSADWYIRSLKEIGAMARIAYESGSTVIKPVTSLDILVTAEFQSVKFGPRIAKIGEATFCGATLEYSP